MMASSVSSGKKPDPTGHRNQTNPILYQEVLKCCEKYKGNPAIFSANQSIDYGALPEKVDFVADQIQRLVGEQNGNHQVLVGLHFQTSVENYVALLAVLKCGFAFIPLPSEFPALRIKFLVDDARPSIIITTPANLSYFDHCYKQDDSKPEISLGSIGNEEVLFLNFDRPSALSCFEADKAKEICYIMYTSGSTGKPKGVAINQTEFIKCLYALGVALDINSSDVICHALSIGFDISLLEIFGGIFYGATLAVFDQNEVFGREFWVAVEKKGVTFCVFSPSMLSIYTPRQSTITKIASTGEPLPLQLAKDWSSMNTKVYNSYGTTECTVFTTVFTFDPTVNVPKVCGAFVPLGKAISNHSIILLDSELKPVKTGEVGDIYLGGDGVGCGYIGHAQEMNPQKFIYVGTEKQRVYRSGDIGKMADGELLYLGRKDDQVQVHGVVVECVEVENSLLQISNVKKAVVLFYKSEKLVAFISPPQNVEKVRKRLHDFLPSMMIPHLILPINQEDIPLNQNGKTDKKQLATMVEAVQKRLFENQELVEEISDGEKVLKKIWIEVLKLAEETPIGSLSSYESLGGDKHNAVVLQSKIETKYGVKVPLVELYESNGLKDMFNVVHKYLQV